MFAFLSRLLGRPRLGHLHFVLLTRKGCHLCEQAERLLQKEQRRHDFIFEIVDIDSKDELEAKFGQKIPVVTVNGQIRFSGRINPVLLRRLLRAEAGRKRK